MNINSEQEEIDKYWPKNHALDYYKKMLVGLLVRVERTKEKIAKLEEQDE